MKLTRRRLMVLASAGATGVVSAVQGNDQGSLAGGTMALNEAYRVAEGVWIGPDSAKSEVDAEAGSVYMASDTDVDYYGDGGSWTKRSIGSEAEPVPSTHSESISTDKAAIAGKDYDPTIEEGETNVKSLRTQYGSTYRDQKPGDRNVNTILYRNLTGYSTTSTSYVQKEVIPVPPLVYPSGTVPVIAVRMTLSNDTDGEGVKTNINLFANSDGSLKGDNIVNMGIDEIDATPTREVRREEYLVNNLDSIDSATSYDGGKSTKSFPSITVELSSTSSTATASIDKLLLYTMTEVV